jgi:ABC-type polysaccharide/polyol phosphate transport system ATPase subunit
MSSQVRLDGAGVRFALDRQRRVVTPALERFRRRGEELWGLRGATLAIGPGIGVALLGSGGSGKTTLLRLLAGVLEPDEGRVAVTGRTAALLSPNAGLLPLLTGRENAELLGVLYGLSRRQARLALDELCAGSGFDDAFERPVSTYSQGMRARLGLALAEQSDPQVLLLDEVHEVLDHSRRALLAQRVEAILGSGGIVVAAGHDHPLLARLATHAIWLEKGSIRAEGPFLEVQSAYIRSTTAG